LEELERSVEPSWPKLVEPLEKIVDRLAVVWGMVNHLKAVKDNSELRSAIEDVQVLLVFVLELLLCVIVHFSVLLLLMAVLYF
jgi:Zn-dependent oligopeptidase